MLITVFRTAVSVAAAISAAVFFSATTSAGVGSSLGSLDSSMNELVYQISPSVVMIQAADSLRTSSMRRNCPPNYQIISSGIVTDSNGHVMTAASAVAGKSIITINYEGGTANARVVGIDYQSGLALLQADRPVGKAMKICRSYACVGQMVLMMGNAYGLRASPSLGFCAGARPEGTLQFQAMMTSGSLGGGLFDLSGKLVGLVVGGIAQKGQPEVGLAIPAYRLSDLIDYLLDHGDRVAGYIGISVTETEIFPPVQVQLPPKGIQFTGTRNAPTAVVSNGLLVSDLAPYSPGAAAGLRINDLLFQLDGETITSAISLMGTVRAMRPGSDIEFLVIRQNRAFPVTVHVGEATLASLTRQISDDPGTYEQDHVNDSLILEIQKLKAALLSIEQKLIDRDR